MVVWNIDTLSTQRRGLRVSLETHTEYAMLAVYKIEALRLRKECHSVQSNRKFSLKKFLYIF